MAKSDQTKQKLFDTALKMFLEQGFDKTTMRAIATKADVATSAIYYYFPSKESVIQEYYEQSHEEHEKLIADFLKTEKSFAKRLHRVVTAKIEVALPYKKVVRALYQVAANPESPSSPFSEESKALRQKAIHLFEELVDGSEDSFHPQIKKDLGKYLWFYQMGVILFWIYDNSKDSKKTFEFIDKTVPLIVWLNEMLQSAWAVPFRKKVIATIKSFNLDIA